MKRSPPALIVFCRQPIPNQTKTRLIGRLTPDGAAALADAFIRDALAKAAAIEPSKLVIAGSAPAGALTSAYFKRLARRYDAVLMDQGEGSLGARMARVLEPFSSDGAILIGTDTPSLPADLLKRSLDALRIAPVVIAPSLDGGYYAVGVRGAMPPIFSGIRWGTAGVLAETMRRLKTARLRCAPGPAWYDVDRWSDLMLLAAHLRLLAQSQRGAGQSPCPATAFILRRLGVLGDDR